MSTNLGPLYLGDVYRQLARFGGQLSSTRQAVGDWSGADTILKVSLLTVGPDGRVYVQLDADEEDNSPTLEALDTTAINHLVIVNPGTYQFSGWTINNLRELTWGSGVTLQAADALDDGTKLIDIARSDFTLHMLGTLDGNRDGQTFDVSGIHSIGYDRVRVLGYGRAGYITGCSYIGGWLRDGDDLLLQGLRVDDTGNNGLVLELATNGQTLRRGNIDDCFVDRSADGDTITQGAIKIIKSSADATVPEDCNIKNSYGKLHATANAEGNVAVEIFALGNRCHIINTVGDGGLIALSNLSTKGQIKDCDALNFNGIGKETAGASDAEIDGGSVVGPGTAGSIGVSADNATVSGSGHRVTNQKIENCQYGVYATAGGSTTQSGVITEGNVITSAVTDAQGVTYVKSPKGVTKSNVITLTGSVSAGLHGINGGTDVSNWVVTGNTITLPNGGTTGVRIVDGDGAVVTGNSYACPSGTATNPVLILNSSNVTFDVTYTGTWTNAFQIVANAESHDKITILGVTGPAASISLLEQSGGTLGNNITTGTLNGPTPYTVTQASFKRLKASWADCIWGSGVMAVDPNTIPVDGEIGSMLTDATGAALYFNTDGSNTGWGTVTVT